MNQKIFKKIIVASTNAVKINAAMLAFSKMFPEINFSAVGVSVKSGVSQQPMTEKETLKGAENRAKNAHKKIPEADYWVGIEGGIEEIDGEMEVFAWIVVLSKENYTGKGRTGSFFLPENIIKLIKQGMELGEADDLVFNQRNSKQAGGTVGTLTGGVLTRTDYYEPAVILALIPIKNPQIY